MAVLMFLVPRSSGGGAEKVIVSLASHMAKDHKVYLVTTVRENGVEGYPLSKDVSYINVYHWAEWNKTGNPAESSTAQERKQKACRQDKIALFARKVLSCFAGKLPSTIVEPAKAQITNADFSFQIQTVKEMKRALDVDCAISFLNSANYINVMSCIGEKTIVSFRSYPENHYAPADNWTESGRSRIQTVCDRADWIVPVAKETADCIADVYGVPDEKLRVIYNYIDMEDICRKREQRIIDLVLKDAVANADFVFVSTGRLTEKKGHWHLIRAFREVLNVYPNTLLIIPGRDGKGKDNVANYLKYVIEENDMKDKVLLPGWCANPYSVLACCNAFVETSFNEGFPNALVEAMAMKLPVISTDCSSGPREILAPGTDYRKKTDAIEYAEYGILVPVCSGNKRITEPTEPEEELLAKAMLALIEETKLRDHYSSKSFERVNEFQKEQTIAQWEALVNKEIRKE